MRPTDHMRHLTTVQGSFHGRVLAARLGAEGILVQLRGLTEGPYPLPGAVEVFVSDAQLDLAREILLADAVDAAVDAEQVELEYSADRPEATELSTCSPVRQQAPRPLERLAVLLVLALVAALIVAAVVAG